MQITEERQKRIFDELGKYGITANEEVLAAVVAIQQQRGCQYPTAVKAYAASIGVEKKVGKRTERTEKTASAASSGASALNERLDAAAHKLKDAMKQQLGARAVQLLFEDIEQGDFGDLALDMLDAGIEALCETVEEPYKAIASVEDSPKYLLAEPVEQELIPNGSGSVGS
jgi:hypothetical protein